MPKQLVTFLLFCIITVQYSLNSTAACIKTNKDLVSLKDYYRGTTNLEKKQLHKALNSIVKQHKAFKYSPCVWTILKQTDVDPRNSANVIGFYTGRAIKKSRQVSGGGNSNDWNREHIWAKSHGFKGRKQHAHTDVHHIRAIDVSVNADRGNRDFDFGGIANKECRECLMGPIGDAVNGTNGTWESPDRVKGDTARMMFYMAVRYDGNDRSRTPDLVLVNNTTKVGEARFGKLCSLLQWHRNDPVSDAERLRNDIIYSWQGNRNPFIDRPEFVDRIWGDKCADQIPDPEPISDKGLIIKQLNRIENELQQLRVQVQQLE